jgi:hypothetical protein
MKGERFGCIPQIRGIVAEMKPLANVLVDPGRL